MNKAARVTTTIIVRISSTYAKCASVGVKGKTPCILKMDVDTKTGIKT